MQLIQGGIATSNPNLQRVELRTERATLAKRRWRGTAEDGIEFGFDLHHPLEDGAVFFETESAAYVIAQKAEPVLELRVSDFGFQNATDAARVGWLIGNLHFALEIAGEKIRVADDPALRQLFEREHWKYEACEAVFHPMSGGHHH
jgi:urease accessory protein